MSLVLNDCKGHVHIVESPGSGSGAGFYKISPSIPDREDAKALILGIPLNFREIAQPTVTLDDDRSIYIFGSAWNEASLSGLLLLGKSATKGALLSNLLSWYDENRVSKKKAPVQLSLGTSAVDAYVIGLRLDAANAQNNSQVFSIILLTSDIKTTG